MPAQMASSHSLTHPPTLSAGFPLRSMFLFHSIYHLLKGHMLIYYVYDCISPPCWNQSPTRKDLSGLFSTVDLAPGIWLTHDKLIIIMCWINESRQKKLLSIKAKHGNELLGQARDSYLKDLKEFLIGWVEKWSN